MVRNSATIILLVAAVSSSVCLAASYDVGAGKPYSSISSLPALQPGDTVNIYPGTYNEYYRFTANGTTSAPITIRGIGSPKPVIDGTGLILSGVLPTPRALFQFDGANYIVQNLEFQNGHNNEGSGDGVRVNAAANITLQNLYIHNCDMGIQCNDNDNFLIDSCEIAFNGAPASANPPSHNIYVNANSVTMQYCYVHDATTSQNFKSRSHYSKLLYNYIADSLEGEVVLVDSATETTSANSNAVMIGNTVVSKNRPSTSNQVKFVEFGQDNANAHVGSLYAVNNTFVAANSYITFYRITDVNSKIVSSNNIFYGSNSIVGYNSGSISGNNNWMPSGATVPATFTSNVFGAAPGFSDTAGRDFHLVSTSNCINAGSNAPVVFDGSGASFSGVPTQEYVKQLAHVARTSDGALDIGAYEYVTAGTPPAAPSSLVARAVSPSQVNLTWADNSNNETGFKLEQSAGSSGVYTQIATTAANVTSYSVTGLAGHSSYTYRVRATNSSGDSGYSNTANATTLDNAPLLASAANASPNPALVSQIIQFSAAASDADNDALSYAWTFGDGATGAGSSAQHAYSAAGTYTASVLVTDGFGGSVSSSISVIVNASTGTNHPPVISTAAAANPSPAQNSQQVTFTVAATDPDGDPLTYSWNFGDSTTGSGATVQKAYPAAGVYSATVTVSDGKGGTATSSVTVTVDDSAGTTPTGLAATAASTSQINLTWNAASDPQSGIMKYNVYRNGARVGSTTGTSYSDTGLNAGTSYMYNVSSVNGVYFESALSAAVTTSTLSAGNSPPVIDTAAAASPNPALISQTVNFSVTAHDPNSDPLTYSWNFGDSTTGLGATTSHAYASAGSYTAVITVSDGKDGSVSSSVVVTVNAPSGNRPPVITTAAAANPSPAQNSQQVTFTVSASDADGDPLSYSWNFGDSTTGSGATVQKAYPAAGVYSATVTVSDGKGGTATSSVALTVDDSAGTTPTGLTATAASTSQINLTWNAASDPQSGIIKYNVYRNGAKVGSTTGTSYSDTGLTAGISYTYNVSSVNGVYFESALSAAVTTSTLSAGNSPPVIDTAAAASPNPALISQTVNFSVTAHDPNSDPLTYSWKFGDAATGSGATASHAYASAGSYTAVVTVSDGKGGTVSSSVTVTVNSSSVTNHPPVISTAAAANPSPAQNSQQVTFTVAATDADGDPLTYSWNFGDSTTGSGSSVRKAYPAAGVYTATVSVSDGKGGTATSSVMLTVDDSPSTTPTGLTATAVSPTQINLTWNAASDPQSGIMKYNVYRNGAKVGSATGTSYSDTGLTASTSYTYTVTAINGVYFETVKSSPATATTLASAAAAMAPVAGPSPADPMMALLAGNAVNSTPLAANKLSILLNFARPGSDSLTLDGSIPLSPEFRPQGQQIGININGLILTFTLNKSGAGKNGNATFKLRAQRGSGQFTLRISRTSLTSTLAPLGLADGATAGQATVPVTLLMNGALFHADRTVRYTGKPGKAISAK